MKTLLTGHIPRLRRYARALTQSTEAADDLVQDSLERALRKKHLFQPDTNLLGWLMTLMHNVYVNSLRRDATPRMEPGPGAIAESGQSGPESSARLRDLEKALALLSPEHREVLLLVCLEDLTYEQAASALGIPVGTVMSRLHRARERLRRYLDDEARPALRRIK